jgi:tRNA pseudouridine13 synthase
LKDRRAITRQWVSVPEKAESHLKQIDGEGMRLLQVSRHGNKLRPGHLHGNRFRIRVRAADPQAAERLGPLLQEVRDRGLPNYYGPQRFGKDGETVKLGLALLRGEPPPISESGRKPKLRSPFLRKLALSAAQSALFNHYLGSRLTDGLFRKVLAGDVMAKWPFGGMFVAEDVTREQERFDRRETVHAGPIFGRKTFASAGETANREAATLTAFGLTLSAFRGFGKLMQGTRRHNVIYIEDLKAAMDGGGVLLTFSLPAGSYASVLLHELMKTQIVESDEVVDDC